MEVGAGVWYVGYLYPVISVVNFHEFRNDDLCV